VAAASVTHRFRYAPSYRQSGSDRLPGGPLIATKVMLFRGQDTSHFSWQKLALLKCLGEVWRDLRDDPHWKYERLSPVRLLKKSGLRRHLIDNDELARANWFWRRRPRLLSVVSLCHVGMYAKNPASLVLAYWIGIPAAICPEDRSEQDGRGANEELKVLTGRQDFTSPTVFKLG